MTEETKKVVMCSTKTGELWHIKRDVMRTHCGRLIWDFVTNFIELPTDDRLICSQCLKGIVE